MMAQPEGALWIFGQNNISAGFLREIAQKV
jgi:hypothetical protein